MAVTVKATASPRALCLRLFSKLAKEFPGFEVDTKRNDGLENAFFKPGETYFAGRVLSTTTRTVEVMSDMWETDRFVTIILESGETEEVNLGSAGDATYEVDATPEALSKYETYANVLSKLELGQRLAAAHAKDLEPRLKKGGKALAFKGRKVKVGTEVEIFWSGTVHNKFAHCNEHRLGVILPGGDKVWVSADNFEPLPSPADMVAYAAALKTLAEANAALENPLAHKPVAEPLDDDALERESAVGNLRPFDSLTHAEKLALMSPRVLAREMVRAAFGDEAVAEREEVVQGEHERHHEAEYQQEVQMGDG